MDLGMTTWNLVEMVTVSMPHSFVVVP